MDISLIKDDDVEIVDNSFLNRSYSLEITGNSMNF